MLPWVCSVIDHRRRQNVVNTSVTHSAIASCATFLFLPHFDVICDLLLNRRTATWNLFVNLTVISSYPLFFSFHLLFLALLLGCLMAIPVLKWRAFVRGYFFFSSVSVKVLPVTPLLSGIFVHRAI